jgi:hypothetical protein
MSFRRYVRILDASEWNTAYTRKYVDEQKAKHVKIVRRNVVTYGYNGIYPKAG